MEKPIHYRRCHVCGGMNQITKGKVMGCSHCGRSLAPFYYFDDTYTQVLSENQVRLEEAEHEYRPIYGLTVYWDSY